MSSHASRELGAASSAPLKKTSAPSKSPRAASTQPCAVSAAASMPLSATASRVHSSALGASPERMRKVP